MTAVSIVNTAKENAHFSVCIFKLRQFWNEMNVIQMLDIACSLIAL